MSEERIKNVSTGDWAFVGGLTCYNVAVIVLALVALAVTKPSELYFVLSFLFLLAVYGGVCYGASRFYDNHARLLKFKSYGEARNRTLTMDVVRLESEVLLLQATVDESERKVHLAEEATRSQAGRVMLTQAAIFRLLTRTDTYVVLTVKGADRYQLTVQHGVIIHQTDVDRRVVALAGMLEYRHPSTAPQDPIHPIVKRHKSLEQLCDAVFEVTTVTNTTR